jgi:hypothetical protein
MDSQLDNPKRKPLVTVEFQTEIDVATGNREKRMFVKMYFDARDSGLLAALPDELWKTLCCLATYIDEDGNCCPSQALLGKAWSVSRQHINYRIKRLLAFRFHGEPILTVTKSRQKQQGGSRWANNVYRLRPITGLAMFDQSNNDAASKTETERAAVYELRRRSESAVSFSKCSMYAATGTRAGSTGWSPKTSPKNSSARHFLKPGTRTEWEESRNRAARSSPINFSASHDNVELNSA